MKCPTCGQEATTREASPEITERVLRIQGLHNQFKQSYRYLFSVMYGSPQHELLYRGAQALKLEYEQARVSFCTDMEGIEWWEYKP